MKKFGAELKRHALTAISYMLPLVVASGLLIAIGNLMGGEVVTDLSKMTIPSALTSLGVLGMGLLPSFIAGKPEFLEARVQNPKKKNTDPFLYKNILFKRQFKNKNSVQHREFLFLYQ